MLFFAASFLTSIFSGSVSFSHVPSFAGLETDCSTFLQLIRVITALNSSIRGVGSLEELNLCTPLGLGCVWEGNFPFSCTCCWLVNLEIEYCKLSNFWAISDCRFSIFLFSVLLFFHKTAHHFTQIHYIAFSIGDEDGGGCD